MSGAQAIRVLIADDHDVVRQGMRAFLATDSALEIVGEATNGVEAVRLARRLRPDVILMDLVMPELDGISALRLIRQDVPETKVLVLTSMLDSTSVVEVMRAGGMGYLLKDMRATGLLRAIKVAAAGQVQFSPEAAAVVRRAISTPERRDTLSGREVDVLRQLARGLANKEIARELAIAEKTVKTHVSNILAKLGVQSRTQAALLAGRIGVVPSGELGAL